MEKKSQTYNADFYQKMGYSLQKEGKLKKNKDVTVVDLPGIYSLSPYTLEEVVARNYLVEESKKRQILLFSCQKREQEYLMVN